MATKTPLELLHEKIEELFAQEAQVEQTEQECFRITEGYEEQVRANLQQMAELEASKCQCTDIDGFNTVEAQIKALQEQNTGLATLIENSKAFTVQEVFKQVDLLVPMLKDAIQNAYSVERLLISTVQLKDLGALLTDMCTIQQNLGDVNTTIGRYARKYERHQGWQYGTKSIHYSWHFYQTASGDSLHLSGTGFNCRITYALADAIKQFKYNHNVTFA